MVAEQRALTPLRHGAPARAARDAVRSQSALALARSACVRVCARLPAGDGTIDMDEFRKGVAALGYDATEEKNPDAHLNPSPDTSPEPAPAPFPPLTVTPTLAQVQCRQEGEAHLQGRYQYPGAGWLSIGGRGASARSRAPAASGRPPTASRVVAVPCPCVLPYRTSGDEHARRTLSLAVRVE